MFTHLPPHRLHASKPISPDNALSLLSAYIIAAESDPSLQPNAILTETGPSAAAHAAGSSLAIHNLKRVEAGLRGEQLGVDLTLSKEGPEGAPALLADESTEKKQKQEKKRRRSEIEQVNMGVEGWEDPEEYARGREVDNVDGEDIGERMQASADGVEARRNQVVAEEGRSKEDREARKKAKKERNKAEKKDREKQRLGTSVD